MNQNESRNKAQKPLEGNKKARTEGWNQKDNVVIDKSKITFDAPNIIDYGFQLIDH